MMIMMSYVELGWYRDWWPLAGVHSRPFQLAIPRWVDEINTGDGFESTIAWNETASSSSQWALLRLEYCVIAC